jgi:hypothetical protein
MASPCVSPEPNREQPAVGDIGYNATTHTKKANSMSTTQARMILESIDMVDFEDREEAMFTLAQAEMEDNNEDEWEDILLSF